MNIRVSLLLGIAISVVVSFSQGRNSISGIVFGESRTPLENAYVELLDELGTTIIQSRTNGSGRYAFYGLSSGRFKIRVFPVGTDYMEQTQEVLLSPVSAIPGSGGDNQQIDFYLRLREGANAGPFSVPSAVFAQEVPEEARVSASCDKKRKRKVLRV
jgi:hypothetical protein